MGGLTLIRAAHALEILISAEGDKLVVRGPKEYRAVAAALLAEKTRVISLLGEPVSPFWPPEVCEIFVERLAVADDLELDTSPGSCAWAVAVREAEEWGGAT